MVAAQNSLSQIGAWRRDDRVDLEIGFMFYPGTDAALQIPVAAAVAGHVVRLA